jgi:putative two-component system response regulator
MLEATLREWGYEVQAVTRGDEAWEVLQQPDAPKIAILDWMMPGLDGPDICRKVRALNQPEPPYLLLLTSKERKANSVVGLEGGADDFLTKPFDRDELRARLRVGERIVGLQTSQTVVFAFARAVEVKSPFTQGHSARVGSYALALADRLNLSKSDKDRLRRGAAVHDLGKIGTPEAILNKPARLTPEEMAVVQMHPDQGVKIVEQLQSMQDLIPLIRWHHERMDGRGYPDGLTGNVIPLLVRILAVADVYDALASRHPYREALPYDQCLAELRADAAAGGLDAELVECFAGIQTIRVASQGCGVCAIRPAFLPP